MGGDGSHATNNFFVHVKVMSIFSGKVPRLSEKFRVENKLVYPGDISHFASPGAFNALITDLYKKKWVVYCKPPFNETKDVLEYLGRYTHRIAISNHRLVKLENDEVSFRWRDYSDNNKVKIMPLKADEFIRRLLLHVLPDKFVKIRHYSLLGNRCRRKKLDRCREASGLHQSERIGTEDRNVARSFTPIYRHRHRIMSCLR